MRAAADRGFFVEAGALRDAYISGSLKALPEKNLLIAKVSLDLDGSDFNCYDLDEIVVHGCEFVTVKVI